MVTDCFRHRHGGPINKLVPFFAHGVQCTPCAKRRLRLVKKMSPMKLSTATAPLASVHFDMLGSFPTKSRPYRFLLVISDLFANLTQAVPPRQISTYDVAAAFLEN